MLRKFDSGVMVIQNKSHSDEEVILLSLYKLFHVDKILQLCGLKHISFLVEMISIPKSSE